MLGRILVFTWSLGGPNFSTPDSEALVWDWPAFESCCCQVWHNVTLVLNCCPGWSTAEPESWNMIVSKPNAPSVVQNNRIMSPSFIINLLRSEQSSTHLPILLTWTALQLHACDKGHDASERGRAWESTSPASPPTVPVTCPRLVLKRLLAATLYDRNNLPSSDLPSQIREACFS